MNYKDFCQLFYAAHNIPIAYFKDRQFITFCGYPDYFSPSIQIFDQLSASNKIITTSLADDNCYYGLVQLNADKNTSLLIGPVISSMLNEEIIHSFMRAHSIPSGRKNILADDLNRLARVSYHQFTNILSMAFFTIHRKKPALEDLYSIANPNLEKDIAKKVSHSSYEAREEQNIHGTYVLEQQILSYVKSGNVAQLENFLLQQVKNQPLSEGTVGDSPLRQAKNIFLGQVATIGKFAAIPAGLDIELTYQLIDQYSLECERLQTIFDITSLQYNMLVDFTKRISEKMTPSGLSKDVYTCIQFVNGHVNENISVDDVSNHIHRSRSYTLSHFKEELGFNLGEYITHAKIQEAKSLLTFTDKSLSEISNYLCFSSQSYFQNVFKKIAGETPLSYRKKTQK